MHAALSSRASYDPGVAQRLTQARTAPWKGLWASFVSVIILLLSAGTLMGAPTSVASSQAGDATSLTYQRKIFRDGSGNFWVFFFDGSHTYYTRSDDTTGASWTGIPVLFYTGHVQPCVWFESDTLYVAFASANNILVQRGIISGGSITWSAVYTAFTGDPTTSYTRASVCRDSDGFIWVCGRVEDPTGYYACASRSSSPNDISSWQSPDILSPVSSNGSLYALVVPLNGGDVYAVWNREGWMEGKRYVSGTGWEAGTTAIANGFPNLPQRLFSAVSDKDGRVHLLYISDSGRAHYKMYDGASWGSEQILSASLSGYPTLSINPSNQRLYALWIESRRVECRSAVLPSSSSDWSTESTSREREAKGYLTSGYSSTSRISWLFTEGRRAPYSVMIDGIAVARISVLVSVSSFSFGTQPVDTWLLAQNTQITNDGTCAENIYTQLSQFASGPFTWAVSDASNGTDVCRAQWSTSSDAGPWIDIASYDSEFLVRSDLGAGNSVTLYFRIQTPTSTSSFEEYSADLTVRAEDF
ncbi:MAG: hypothetical protein AMJ46_09610 [Latescibacteria bacterium DG_63]|nr:MAG: hypothetical protein AMJ46_09610 [Latescibacteria bacterium DG_63]